MNPLTDAAQKGFIDADMENVHADIAPLKGNWKLQHLYVSGDFDGHLRAWADIARGMKPSQVYQWTRTAAEKAIDRIRESQA